MVAPDEVALAHLSRDEGFSYIAPDEAALAHMCPDEAAIAHMCPDEAALSHMCPDEAAFSRMCQDESTTEHKEPDGANEISESKAFDKQKNAQLLASKYTSTKRAMEIFSVYSFILLSSVSFLRVCNLYFLQNIWIILCACVLSMCLADFFSGIVHWAADTWGNLETPLLGGSIIRSFREHHLVPTAICKHDLFETNGDNCMIVLPFVLLTALTPVRADSLYFLFVHSFIVQLCIWVGLTNQIHKWSHTYKAPWYVKLMQSCGFVLSRKDHAVHHRNPFDKFYCITNGWLNPPLAAIDFWKRLESVVTFVTGAVPREDDMLWTGISAKLQ